MRNFNMKLVFQQARGQADFFRYFPDSCYKKYPPKEYFWRVYATLHPDTFHELYGQQVDRLRKRIRRPQALPIAPEHLGLLQRRVDDNLTLLNRLRQPGVQSNITYLRRSRRHAQPQRGPIDQFLQHPQNPRQQPIFRED